jgi:ferric-dicitrate binding protein FerR (iron transport regulator)
MLSWFEAKVSKGISNPGKEANRVMRLVLATALFVAMAPAQTGGEAKLIAMSGQVSVLRGSATWALNTGDIIRPQQTVVTGPDGMAKFQVSDGSTFDVYPSSQVVFRNNPGNLQDLVDVFLGKIKVKIEHFGNVPNHNTVRTPTAVIAVRGTIFDVDVSGTDETTQVLCEEGRVEVFHLNSPGSKSRVLEPGESVTVFKNQPLAKNSVDRGAVLQKLFRAMSDAADQILLHRAGGTGTGSTTTSTATGDKGGTPAPTGGGAPPPPPHN